MSKTSDPRDPRVPLEFVRQLALILDENNSTLKAVQVELKHINEERESLKKKSPQSKLTMKHLVS